MSCFLLRLLRLQQSNACVVTLDILDIIALILYCNIMEVTLGIHDIISLIENKTHQLVKDNYEQLISCPENESSPKNDKYEHNRTLNWP